MMRAFGLSPLGRLGPRYLMSDVPEPQSAQAKVIADISDVAIDIVAF